MHVICVAAARMRVESVRELIISIYENRNNKFRPISEERVVLEMNIAINVAIARVQAHRGKNSGPASFKCFAKRPFS
jgi:hypothetical protein